MQKTRCIFIIFAVMVFVAAGGVGAQFDRSDDAIRYRQALMTLVGVHFGRMAQVIKGKQPFDPVQFQNEATVLAMLSKLPWEAFSYPGSDKGKTTLSSKALKNGDEFLAAARVFESKADGLAAAAKEGDLSALKAPFGAAARTCEACHREFRSR